MKPLKQFIHDDFYEIFKKSLKKKKIIKKLKIPKFIYLTPKKKPLQLINGYKNFKKKKKYAATLWWQTIDRMKYSRQIIPKAVEAVRYSIVYDNRQQTPNRTETKPTTMSTVTISIFVRSRRLGEGKVKEKKKNKEKSEKDDNSPGEALQEEFIEVDIFRRLLRPIRYRDHCEKYSRSC